MIKISIIVLLLVLTLASTCTASYKEMQQDPFTISFDIYGDPVTVLEDDWAITTIEGLIGYEIILLDKDGKFRTTMNILESDSEIYQIGSIKDELVNFTDIREYTRYIDGQKATVGEGLHPNGINKWTVFTYDLNYSDKTDKVVVYSTLSESNVSDLMNTLHIEREESKIKSRPTVMVEETLGPFSCPTRDNRDICETYYKLSYEGLYNGFLRIEKHKQDDQIPIPVQPMNLTSEETTINGKKWRILSYSIDERLVSVYALYDPKDSDSDLIGVYGYVDYEPYRLSDNGVIYIYAKTASPADLMHAINTLKVTEIKGYAKYAGRQPLTVPKYETNYTES